MAARHYNYTHPRLLHPLSRHPVISQGGRDKGVKVLLHCGPLVGSASVDTLNMELITLTMLQFPDVGQLTKLVGS